MLTKFGIHYRSESCEMFLHFRPEEVEQLVCGSPSLDLNELKKVTTYDKGYKNDNQTVRHFWEVGQYLGVNLESCFPKPIQIIAGIGGLQPGASKEVPLVHDWE